MAKDNWQTPQWLFDKLHEANGFTCDVAASDENALCENYFTEENSALVQPWQGKCWMNPPYSNILPWVWKAHKEWKERNVVTVGLLPVDTSTGWFKACWLTAETITFLTPRVQFVDPDSNQPAHGNNRGSMIVSWGWGRTESGPVVTYFDIKDWKLIK